MPADRRAQVRDVARYLRSVRPLDPAELTDYVEGDVDAATIHADLHALAPDLGLVERADGTFAPVPDGTIPTPEDGIDALPPPIESMVEQRLTEAYGQDWATGASGEHLRSTIDALKADYYRQHPVDYDTDVAFAYTIYHLASYYATGYHVATELAAADLLEYDLRVLDVGAGVGAPALGFFAALPEDALVEYHAIEPGAGADLLATLLEATGSNVHPTLHRTTAEAYEPDEAFDVVVFANVLAELDDPVAVTTRYLEALTPSGTMVLVAPADEATSTGLRAVERALVDDRELATVYAPTVRLWPDAHPTDRGWSFVRKDDIAAPSFQTQLAGDEATYRHTSVQYSYAYLRTDGRQRYDITLTTDEAAKMAEMDAHVTNRVDVVAAKLSPDLGTENPLFKVSDGSEAVDHYAVLVHESPLTEPLRTAAYGTVLRFENVLVLWNDDEDGYNLVVDDEAVVDIY
ncbi:MAG: methyltransferase [Halobacteriaceae archaeon]